MRTQDIVIIDGGGANFTSVMVAFERLGIRSRVSSDPQVIRSADKVILPGVGAAHTAMNTLRDRDLVNVIRSLTQPILGICLGQQVLCADSEEGDCACLGLIPISVKRLRGPEPIPHMGWNTVLSCVDDPLLHRITQEDDLYFVHGYAPEDNTPYTLARCDYGGGFSAVIKRDNVYGVQFHPEKSSRTGARLLQNFCEL